MDIVDLYLFPQLFTLFSSQSYIQIWWHHSFCCRSFFKNFCQTWTVFCFFYTIRHIFPSTPSSQNFSVSQYARRGLVSACLFIFHLHRVIDTVQSNATTRCNGQTRLNLQKVERGRETPNPRTPPRPRYSFLTASPPPARTPRHWIQHHSECQPLISGHIPVCALRWQLSLSVTRNKQKKKKYKRNKPCVYEWPLNAARASLKLSIDPHMPVKRVNY